MNMKMIFPVSLLLFELILPCGAGAFQTIDRASSGVVEGANAFAVDGMYGDEDRSPVWRYNVSLLALADSKEKEKETAVSDPPRRTRDWHKILGYGTIISAVATVATGFAGPEGPHCGLAALATGLAAATCVNGFWTYGNIFTAGDVRLGIHAMSGVLSTIGFGAATALADDTPHGGIGAASGALFMVTVSVVYF